MSDRGSGKGGEQLPISAHPAFPAIVALWFAALLGLGCLVLPTALIERVALGSGIASMIEAAQPPLGVTTRILVAVAAAVLGALGGLIIARKVKAASEFQPTSRRAANLRSASEEQSPFAKRPISAHEELGSEGLGDVGETARAPIRGRRRPLSVTEENARSDFLEFAPLPGQGLGEQPVSVEPLELVDLAEPETASPASADEQPAVQEAPVAAPAADLPFGTAALSRPGPSAAYQEFVMPEPVAAAPLPFVRAEQSTPSEPQIPANEESGLGSLGMVELVERFARALEQHQTDARAATTESEPTPLVFPPAAVPFAEAAERAPAPPVPTIPSALRPIDFGLGDELDEDDDPLAGFDLAAAMREQPRPFAAPVEAADPTTSDPDEVAEEILEDSYTSLLAMKRPLAGSREPVRIDDEDTIDEEIEPVVVFPGQSGRQAAPATEGPARDIARFAAPSGFRAFDRPGGESLAGDATQPLAPIRASDPADTERALREALEKLQKLSGAA